MVNTRQNGGTGIIWQHGLVVMWGAADTFAPIEAGSSFVVGSSKSVICSFCDVGYSLREDLVLFLGHGDGSI